MEEDPAAGASDVDRIAGSLPHTTWGTTWGDMPTWLVGDPATKAKPQGFVSYRRPHHSATDPANGEPYDDLIILLAPDQGTKRALVEGDGPFFDIDHFAGHDGYLVRLSRLGEISVGELSEVITDSWLRAAPAKLRRAFLETRATPEAPAATDQDG